MKRPSAGLLISAGVHAALAAALIAGVSWPMPGAPPSPPDVNLVAIAAPQPVAAPAATPPAEPSLAAPPVEPPLPAPTPSPPPAAPSTASLPLPLPPPPAPPPPAPKASPPARQVALAAPHLPAEASAPAPHAPAAPASGAAPAAPSAEWLRAIAAWLAQHRNYPQSARRAGEEGSVVLRLTVARDGTVLGASLVESSGWRDLDAASLGVVQGAHLPAATEANAPAEITLRVPIRYALESSN